MDKLLDMPVMVHPQLTSDPLSMQGQIGKVIAADLDRNDIVVSFGSQGVGKYQSDALLTIKPHDELYRDLLVNVKQLDDDFKPLLRLNVYQHSGTDSQLSGAFAALRESPQALDFATRPLSEMLEISYGADLQQEKSIGIGR